MQGASFVLSSVPSFFFFSAYMMILCFWGDLFQGEGTYTKINNKIFNFFLIVNGVMYIAAFVLYVLDFVMTTPDDPQSYSIWEQSVLLLVASLYILTSISFFIYGYFTFRYVGGIKRRSPEKNRLLTRVGTITLVSMFCFLIRAALIIWGAVDSNLQWYWWLDSVYYLMLEVIPVMLMLGAYVKPRKGKFDLRQSASSPLIRNPE